MTANQPLQTIVPMLTYEDGLRAMKWLISTFAFRETVRITTPNGGLAHGELETELGGRLMLADGPTGYESANTLAARYAPAGTWQSSRWAINGALVYVPDVIEHFARAKSAGAVILSEIEDGPPGKRYRAADFEGHRWMFIEQQTP
jgi:uncharacterized glyoxalase superfamily protein PhnB